MATTPSPAHSPLHTPPTPRFGAKYDSYQPYSTRRSTRSSARQSQKFARTPSQPSSPADEGTSLTSPPPTSKARKLTRTTNHTFSPPPSTHTSPQKSSGRDTITVAHYDRSEQLSDNTDSTAHRFATMAESGMLPTPAKTPRKRDAAPAAGVSSTARILFPSRPETADEVMPSPKKKTRKVPGFSLDSFKEGLESGGTDTIQIFTDSKDRVPELDTSEDNPFYEGKSNELVGVHPTPRQSKRKDIKRNQEVEEAIKREDGMVYVFRGKKIFRKFEEDDDPFANGPEDTLLSEVDPSLASLIRPNTRSSIKPRLLFPTPQQERAQKDNKESLAASNASYLDPTSAANDEEEAITDIDDSAELEQDLQQSNNTISVADPRTPDTPAFSPATPPSNARTTRASARNKSTPTDTSPLTTSDIDMLDSPQRAPAKRGKKVSPFDGWQRTKGGAATTASTARGKKREGDTIERSGGVINKRTRSGVQQQ
ncbi:MAG: hypothetical protein M1833_002446 [Piccolia ochrophora]|nr:MAG: hypothetical protein M1833_002446 [Piccolia ochrophora]